MNGIQYENFDMQFLHDNGGYRIVVDSLGRYAETSFSAPFTDQELQNFFTAINSALSNSQAAQEIVRRFGTTLFDKAFSNGVGLCFQSCLDEVTRQGKCLRIRLRLKETPELSDLPWEYLCKDDKFIALLGKTPVVRYLDINGSIPPLRSTCLPLRMVVMTSNPGGFLDVEREWKNLNKALSSLIDQGLIKVQREKARMDILQTLMEDEPFDIFHFIGHGYFDARLGMYGGYLCMEGEDGEEHRVAGTRLKHFLGDLEPVRLVFLNACEGSRSSVIAPFKGVAQSLVQAGIPAVIGMQFNITDQAAIEFSRMFYQMIAKFRPIDHAVSEARKAIFIDNDVEWATPTLYMRSPDGHIFPEDQPEKKARPYTHHEDFPYEENAIYYESIIEKIIRGSLVPFLGPSANLCRSGKGKIAYPPDDKEIAQHLAGVYKIEDSCLARLSQRISIIDEDELSLKLHKLLAKEYKPTSLHQMFATLPGLLRNKGYSFPYQLIVTTNYDDGLEQAFNAAQEPFDLVIYIPEWKGKGKFRYIPHDGVPAVINDPKSCIDISPNNRSMILKIHGAINRDNPEEDSYLITEDQYINYMKGKIIPVGLRKKITQSSLLFLGYRQRDWNLRVIFHKIWDESPVDEKSWAVQDKCSCIEEELFWKKRDITPIFTPLEEFVDQITGRLKKLPRSGGR